MKDKAKIEEFIRKIDNAEEELTIRKREDLQWVEARTKEGWLYAILPFNKYNI